MSHRPAAEFDKVHARIGTRLRGELLQPQAADIVAFANHVAEHYGRAVAAILFYGSCLRRGMSDGVIDFYVLVDDYPVPPLSWIGAAAARLLPPNVYHHSFGVGDRVLRAKVAVITQRQWRHRMQPDAVDSSLWARFCQPAALVYTRDAAATDALIRTLSDAIMTAGLWAARLGPDAGRLADYWQALFRATYASELRVESADRTAQIYAAAPERYEAILAEAWRGQGLALEAGSPAENPLPVAARRRSHVVWRRRRSARRSLNALRLVKAAFTFDGGADYIAWKIERHSGRRLELSGFQRKHPVLAVPSLLWRLIRYRIVR